jgi:arylsulfatase A
MKNPATMKMITCACIVLCSLILLTGCKSDSTKLFNGNNLDGWKCEPADQISHWKVPEGGILAGENTDEKPSILWTTNEYGDFEVELDYLALTDDYDSGVFLRGESHQVQIGISRSLQMDMTGCIYAPKDGQGAYPGATAKVADFHRPGEWNHLKIIVKGKNIQTFLNDEPFVDYEGSTMQESGPIGLQLHGGVHMSIQFRDIVLREIAE